MAISEEVFTISEEVNSKINSYWSNVNWIKRPPSPVTLKYFVDLIVLCRSYLEKLLGIHLTNQRWCDLWGMIRRLN